jgi:uncharacterized protein (TIGR03435 family)
MLWSSCQPDAPDWMTTKRFDILAEPSAEGRPTSDEMKHMVQELLAQRFHLVFHESERELPVYAIILAKNLFKNSRATERRSCPCL